MGQGGEDADSLSLFFSLSLLAYSEYQVVLTCGSSGYCRRDNVVRVCQQWSDRARR